MLLLSQDPGNPAVLATDRLTRALERVSLTARVVKDQERWQQLEAVVAIPWEPRND